jgi:RNA polymerase sigma-70 factor (ECF subfamily)
VRAAGVIADRAIRSGARAAQAAMIDGEAGVVIAPRGRLSMLLRMTIRDRKIVAIEAVTKDLQALDLKVL